MIHRIGIYTAITSFIIGTVMFLIFYFTNYGYLVMIPGIIFVIIAGIINTGIIIKIVVNLINEKENRKKYLITSGIMILNIPIALIYYSHIMISLGETLTQF